MAGENSRSNFLFGLTLTELAFILFFILLVLSSFAIQKKVEDIDKLKEEAEVYKKIFEEIPEFNEKTIEEKEKWLKELVEKDKLMVKYQELAEKHKALHDSYQKIVQAIPGLKDKTEAEKAKWLKELVEKSNLDAKNKALSKELDKIKEKLEKLEKEMKLKNEKVASLEKKLAGNRHPDCWQDEKGKYEFIYNIILRDKGITTYRGYKKYLEQKFQEIPGANNIIGTKNISIREFKQKTRSVFNWSVKTAKPECRHWVRIFDETSSSNRSTYKIPLHGIENYFFKKEYRMTYSEFKKILASPSNSMIKNRRNKTGSIFNKKPSRNYTINDCSGENRKHMDRIKLWRDMCSHRDREEALKEKSKSIADDSSKGNGKSSSLINELNKIGQIGKTLQSP